MNIGQRNDASAGTQDEPQEMIRWLTKVYWRIKEFSL